MRTKKWRQIRQRPAAMEGAELGNVFDKSFANVRMYFSRKSAKVSRRMRSLQFQTGRESFFIADLIAATWTFCGSGCHVRQNISSSGMINGESREAVAALSVRQSQSISVKEGRKSTQ